MIKIGRQRPTFVGQRRLLLANFFRPKKNRPISWHTRDRNSADNRNMAEPRWRHIMKITMPIGPIKNIVFMVGQSKNNESSAINYTWYWLVCSCRLFACLDRRTGLHSPSANVALVITFPFIKDLSFLNWSLWKFSHIGLLMTTFIRDPASI